MGGIRAPRQNRVNRIHPKVVDNISLTLYCFDDDNDKKHKATGQNRVRFDI